MKRKILMLAGVAGMLMSSPAVDALAEVNVNVGVGPRRAFVIDRPPSFIQLATPGFSVSYGAPYDIVLYGNDYYLYDNGGWYRSARYDGPWRTVRYRELPPRLRHYRIEQIRRFRDDEYRRHRDRYDRDWRRDGRGDWRDDRRDNRWDDRRPDRWDGPGRHDDGRPMPPR
ncbi:MAG: hypothetical protein HGB15_04810 [Chlorobaculum sp.]|nr:hypothetical protein [Chlorobaculum sp.]